MLGVLSAPNPAEVGFRALNLLQGPPTWGTFLTENVAQGLFWERPLGSKMATKVAQATPKIEKKRSQE